MKINQIVAVAKNGAIGKDNDLIWRLPADLKFFKETTMGSHMIMGRKNYESIGRPLPGRTSVIVTRNKDYQAEGCVVVNSVEEAFSYCTSQNLEEVYVIGGAQIYSETLPMTETIFLTEVHEDFDADTFYILDLNEWKETARTDHKADEKNPYDYSFVKLERA